MVSAAEPREEPAAGGLLDPAIFNLPGIEQLRAWDRGLAPAPPIARLTGIRMTEVAEGTATFTMPASPWFATMAGGLSIGVLAILADPPLGCAIQTMLPPATPYTTAELSLTAVRPVPARGGLIAARGRVVHPGRRMALSEVGHRGRCRPARRPRDVPVHDAAGAGGAATGRSPPAGPAAGRSQRSVAPPARPGRGRGPAGVGRHHGTGGLPPGRRRAASPAADQLPDRPAVRGGRPRLGHFALPASGWVASPTGNVEGGVIGLLADSALQSAITTIAPAGCAVASVDLKINFLRPCPADGSRLIGRGTVVHQGRTVVIANAEVLNADGKHLALATGSALLQTGRPMSLEAP